MTTPTLRKDTDAVSNRFRMGIRRSLHSTIKAAQSHLKDEITIEVIREELQGIEKDLTKQEDRPTEVEDDDFS